VTVHRTVATQKWELRGEVISVRGGAAELGAWGPGLELEATSYPSWATTTAVELPVGACFGWKLAAGMSGAASVRWEGGDDRWACACTAPLAPRDDVDLSATWSW